VGPTKPFVQWIPGFLSQGVKSSRGMMLTHSPPPSVEVVNEKDLYHTCASIDVLWDCFIFTFCTFEKCMEIILTEVEVQNKK
jgi:hypothetical protein